MMHADRWHGRVSATGPPAQAQRQTERSLLSAPIRMTSGIGKVGQAAGAEAVFRDTDSILGSFAMLAAPGRTPMSSTCGSPA